jgi:membrane-bound lytic murein transglycosylase B
MQPWKTTLEITCAVMILPLLLFAPVLGQTPSDVPLIYQSLVHRLSQDGFDAGFLSRLLMDSRAEPIPSVMSIPLTTREVPEIYEQFLTPEAILLAKKFLQENLTMLNEVEKRFSVDREVVTAILLVESRFGENIGKLRVIPTLASMAVMDSPDNVETNYSTLRIANPEITYDWVQGVAKKKAGWAYQELKSFLLIVLRENVDPLDIRGSYAGAVGMAQFVPSSYLGYAESKNGFERWLTSKEDAVFSIGNYLKSHGWNKNLTLDKKKRVLWYYNHSKPYIETVLLIAQKIKNQLLRQAGQGKGTSSSE